MAANSTLQNTTDTCILHGVKRCYENLLNKYLKQFPCVGIIGPRQCGKTTLLKSLPLEWKRFDLERAADFEMIARDPDLFLRLNGDRVALDEAQLVPQVFPALRVAIDERRTDRGRFVVTGSSSPSLLGSITESLAGRIAVIEMAPLSWSEVRSGHPSSALEVVIDRASRAGDVVAAAHPRGSVTEAHEFWLRGGYPEPWVRGDEDFRKAWME